MSRRSRVVLLVVVAIVLLLFVGRWTTLLVAERWWADTISAPAASFVSQVQLLRFLLDLTGSLLAAAWFVGNFYFVYRAIGSVQVPRRMANLEIHEALTPRALLIGTVTVGVFLGLLTGLGTSRWWQSVLLAWQGVSFGSSDPLMGHDLGLYVAQLPIWRRLHGAALLLVLLGLGSCLLLYLLVGAIRWSGRRPAVSDHARRHIGWLLGALALVLAWGYWLEPFETVAGLGAPVRLDIADFHAVVANALTGVALAATLVSIIWAIRPRHLLMVMAWMILAFASILGHHVLPAFAGARDRSVMDSDEGIRRLERNAFGLARMEESPGIAAADSARPPGPVSLWGRDQIQSLGDGDSTTANQSVLRVRGRRLPVWVTVRILAGDTSVVIAYADDRTAATGGPLSYRLADTLAYPGNVRLMELPGHSVRPAAPDYALNLDSSGVRVGSWGRRLILAWARQAGSLFETVPPGSHLAWHLDPLGRFQAIAPHVFWSQPTAHVVEGELVWLADGYVTSGTFPIVDRAPWREREVSAIDVPFLGVIEASSGETRIYRRPSAGPLGRAWQEITGAVAQPWSEVPPAIFEILTYPDELFQLVARVLERSHWLGSRQAGRPGNTASRSLATTAWHQADTSLHQVAAFEATGGHGITAVLSGYQRAAQPGLLLTRIRANEGFGTPSALSRTWDRFATFEQLRDSLRMVNSRDSSSTIRLWVERTGVGAYQVVYGIGPERQVAVAWVNVAARDSMGAGRTVLEAWNNLLGVSAPLLSGGVTGRLAEAEQWMALADSALRRGDWTAFGRAFEALREVLKPEDK
jgi:Uncharacterised protein family (UPF0182)